MVRGGLGSQTGCGKNIKAALLTMAAQRAASGACNGWGPGARLRAPVGIQGEKAHGENLGFYAILGVGELGFSDDFLKQKS